VGITRHKRQQLGHHSQWYEAEETTRGGASWLHCLKLIKYGYFARIWLCKILTTKLSALSFIFSRLRNRGLLSRLMMLSTHGAATNQHLINNNRLVSVQRQTLPATGFSLLMQRS
jgi:hypothetical protein